MDAELIISEPSCLLEAFQAINFPLTCTKGIHSILIIFIYKFFLSFLFLHYPMNYLEMCFYNFKTNVKLSLLFILNCVMLRIWGMSDTNSEICWRWFYNQYMAKFIMLWYIMLIRCDSCLLYHLLGAAMLKYSVSKVHFSISPYPGNSCFSSI